MTIVEIYIIFRFKIFFIFSAIYYDTRACPICDTALSDSRGRRCSVQPSRSEGLQLLACGRSETLEARVCKRRGNEMARRG